MADQIMIQGKVFTVTPPYTAGHVIQENEAYALNQTWKENLRNNFAKTVADGDENGVSQEDLQEKLDAYAQTYAFGVRTGGGRTTDPVEQEARRLAKAWVLARLKRQGKDGQHTAAAISAAAMEILAHEDHGPRLRGKAEENVEEIRRAAAADLSDDDFSMPASGDE